MKYYVYEIFYKNISMHYSMGSYLLLLLNDFDEEYDLESLDILLNAAQVPSIQSLTPLT
jgi:hypothetical protein